MRRITEAEYRKTRVGARLVTVTKLENSLAIIPAGTPLTVDGKWNGFTVLTDPCGSCGIQVKVRQVPARMVDFEHRCPTCSAECTRSGDVWTCTRRSCRTTTTANRS